MGCARLKERFWEEAAPIASEGVRELPATSARGESEVLYRLLVAEIAGQSGDYALALENYFEVIDEVAEPWVTERAAQLALYLDQTDKARRVIDLWLARDPNSLNAHRAALMLALKIGKADLAVTHLSDVLKLAKDHQAEVLLDVLRFLDQNVPAETALEVMAKVSHRFPQSPEVLYAHAMLALRKGETRLALEQTSRAVALRPHWPQLRLLQSQLLAQLGEDEKAQRVLEELVKQRPKDAQLRLLYAQLLLKRQAFAKVLPELKQVLRQEPEHPDALYAYALVNLQQGRDNEAERALQRLVQQAKWRNEAFLYLGRIAAHQGRYEKALAQFEQIAPDSELAFDGQMSAVSVLAKLGRVQEALQRLKQARDRFPDRKLQLYLLEAEIQTGHKDYAGALATLTQALEDFPGHPDIFYARALLAEQMGRVAEAIADFQAALSQRPEDPTLLNALGYTLLEHTERVQEAQKYLDQAIRLKPQDPAILDSYGWLWYKLKNYPKALKYLQQAYALNPDPEIAFHLGEVLWALGRKQEARQVWRNVLKAPQDERVRALIQRFRDRLKP
ncbi:MAG: tetratricopeptide repeat protein [Methylohalobius sp.]|nr:tetratricopeptide repeat protein [Methylohalobius sp.]